MDHLITYEVAIRMPEGTRPIMTTNDQQAAEKAFSDIKQCYEGDCTIVFLRHYWQRVSTTQCQIT